MSKIDELIEKLCPNGVEFMYISEIGKVRMCKRILKSETNTIAGIPFYKIGTFGKEADAFISEEIFKKYKKLYSYPKKGDILISCSGTIGKIVVFDGKPAYFQDSNIVWLEHDESKILNGYLKYIYTTQPWKITIGGTIARLYNDNILNTKIPVPPLEIQCEIVRILDKFSSCSTELIALLKAELKARKQQYEYYREKLLTFEENIHTLTFEEACILSSGGDIKKSNVKSEMNELYNIPVYSNGTGTNALYGYTNIAKVKAPCITISARGTIGYCALREKDFYPIVRLICVKPKIDVLNIEYLMHYIKTIRFKLPTSGIPQLTIPMLKSYKIPIPPLDVQRKIAKILNKFEKLTNDLTEGIPAEIEARQKQYEYYRDKLLTFKELEK